MKKVLTDIIQSSGERFPEKKAYKHLGNTLTFRELNTKSVQLANLLNQLGVVKGNRVGVYMNRELETPIALYGIMLVGAIYVPLDAKSPSDVTRFIIEDCSIDIIVTNESQKRNIKTLLSTDMVIRHIVGAELLSHKCVSWEEVWNQRISLNFNIELESSDPAYILFTSGSTGTPKGILHTHKSGYSYAELTADLYDIQSEDIIANHAPHFFDISLLGYFTAPLVGATTVILSDAQTIMPGSLANLIEKEKISIWYSVPLALIQLIQQGLLQDRSLESLRWVLYAGEPFPVKYLRELIAFVKHARFSNIYGPAETNQCTYFNFSELGTDLSNVPLGQIWDRTKMLIVSDDDENIVDGSQGELLIQSDTMMECYWNQPELTAKSFYVLETEKGLERYYRTGDLVHKDQEGILHFHGRKDHQIKSRGYRVELGAVESILVEHVSVREAAVFAIKNIDETVDIGAAVTIVTDSVRGSELETYLKSKLPHYAVPSKIEIVPSFPRTASGKIDRQLVGQWVETF